MKALVLTAPGILEVLEVEKPLLVNPDEVLVRVRAASICASDTHGYKGKNGRRVPPLIMGHETSGEIEAVGEAVTAVTAGDRVIVMPAISCQECRLCLNDAPDECLQRTVLGADRAGGFAEYVRVPVRAVLRIPDGVSFTQASLVEPLAVVVKGLSRARLTPGDTAAVVGAGPIGLLAIAHLALSGMRHVIAIEPNGPRRDKALEMGATIGLDPLVPGFSDKLAPLTGGAGVDICVEAAGTTASVGVAVNVTRSGGQMVWLGNAGGIVEIDEFRVVWNQLTIYASVGVTRATMLRAIQLIADGAVAVERIVSLEVPLVDAVHAFYRTERDPSTIKTVLHPYPAEGPAHPGSE